MKFKYVEQNETTTEHSLSCKSCDRLTWIEGEAVCFKAGEVMSISDLKQATSFSSVNLTCTNWSASYTTKSK